MTIDITPEEQQILMDSLRDRINLLYDIAERYRIGGNEEAQMDCLDEKKRVQKVYRKITTL